MPKITDEPMVPISSSVPVIVVDMLDDEAERQDRRRADVIRRVLVQWADSQARKKLSRSRPAGPTPT